MGPARTKGSCPAICLLVFLAVLGLLMGRTASGAVPAFAGDAQPLATAGEQIAVLAGGCFWGVDAVFKHVRGVSEVVSGYAGGNAATAHYEVVSTGTTGHAESVRITYDASRISYAELLRIFFSVAHEPTELNRQGPDTGPQYRSAIFYTNEGQKRIALAYIAQLDKAKMFPAAIVTQVTPLREFYPAEAYHQDFVARHPDHPYIARYDLPKLHALQAQFPTLYQQ